MMNLYKPTKKIGTWQQMVVRMTKERDELVAKNRSSKRRTWDSSADVPTYGRK